MRRAGRWAAAAAVAAGAVAAARWGGLPWAVSAALLALTAAAGLLVGAVVRLRRQAQPEPEPEPERERDRTGRSPWGLLRRALGAANGRGRRPSRDEGGRLMPPGVRGLRRRHGAGVDGGVDGAAQDRQAPRRRADEARPAPAGPAPALGPVALPESGAPGEAAPTATVGSLGPPRDDVPVLAEGPAARPGGRGWRLGQAARTGPRHDRTEDGSLADPDLIGVADGVGGGPAGDVASGLALLAVREALDAGAAALAPPTAPEMRTAVRLASAVLRGAAHADPTLRSMATTLDAAWLAADGGAVGVHVGDSAAWLVNASGRARRLTEPDVDADGRLRRAVTTVLSGECSVWSAELAPGDRLVLTTDGFHGHLGPQTSLALLEQTAGLAPSQAAERLVDFAVRAGGRDDVTVVVADRAPSPAGLEATPAAPAALPSRRPAIDRS